MSRVRSLIMKARFSKSQEKALLEIHDPAPTPTGAPQELVGAGAITITEYATNIETDSADAFTLADGVVGQRKLVTCAVYVGDATITPATMANGTLVVLSAVGDSVEFVWGGTAGWNAGALTGTAEIDP